MSLLQILSRIFRSWWRIVTGLLFLVGLYDLFLSQFLTETSRKYFPKLSDIFVRFGWPLWVWVIGLLAITLIAVLEGSYRFINSLLEPPQLKQLGELRAKGIVHRNSGSGGQIMSEKTLERWRKDQLAWEEEVLEILKELSTADYEDFHYLDLWGNRRPFPAAFNDNQRLWLQVYDEKLRRLHEIIMRYSKGKRLKDD
jgi:hypothetical protein